MLLKRKNTLEDLKKKLSKGVYIKSSGTTGESKNIFRTPENLRHCNKSAIDSQKITKNSRIYTVCKMEHAGGMLAQTLPAISIGADIVVEEFNVKRFIKEIAGKNDTQNRIGGTVASSIYLMLQGVQILRIHDVNELLQGIKVFKQIIKN